MTDEHNLPVPDDAPWLNLTSQEIEELRNNKKELSEYGREKIRELMDKKEPIVAKVSESDYQKVFEEYRKQNKKPTLWDIMRDKLGFSIDMCDEIVDAVEEWLPPQHDTNDYQWNRCIRMMREKLR
jgi:hypothetical protein